MVPGHNFMLFALEFRDLYERIEHKGFKQGRASIERISDSSGLCNVEAL